MFDVVRNNKKIVQIFLALITLPFAFFGVESYIRSAGVGGDLAKVGDVNITEQQFQQAMREQQDRLRAQLGAQFDARLLDTPEARKAILDDLIDRQLLQQEVVKRRMVVGDDAIRNAINGIEAFRVDGRFSAERYEAVLKAQGMTPAMFEARLRQDLTLQQLAAGIGQSSIVPRTVTDRILAMQTERREVQEYRIGLDAFLDKVKLADGAAKKFYDENSKQFETPEQAKVEFVVLSMEALGEQLAISDAEARAWYDSHKDNYRQPEERRASHILIATEKLGKDKARARATELLAEIRKNPGSFADLAKKNSDDPGSAAKGGDLGFFGRGMMVKPFEETVFTLKNGEISDIVETDFGYHIIKVTDIHVSQEKPFADVRADIAAELKKTGASRKFAEAAEAFSNLVYEQSDSLKPAAEKFGLTVKQSDWIGRQANPAAGPLGNEKVLAALFGEDAIKSRRNTEAIEIGPNTLVAARVVDYKPASLMPFETVKAGIEALLRRQEAQTMARQDGEARLAALRKGEDKLNWGPAKVVSRMEARQLPAPVIAAIFRMDTGALPSFSGLDVPGSGYVLFRLNRVEAGEALDEARKQALVGQLGTLEVQAELKDYIAALRARYKVEINKAALETREK